MELSKRDDILPKFNKFLESHKTQPGTYSTVININNDVIPKSNYDISLTKKKKFFEMYQEAIASGRMFGRYGFTEVPMEFGYLRLDFDFRWKYNADQPVRRMYTTKHIQTLIELCQIIIESSVVNLNNDMLTCLVLEKERPRVSDGSIKDGFHLRFPYLIVRKEYGDGYFLEQLRSKVSELDVFADMCLSKNDLGSVIDPVMKKNWLLYGSCKNAESGTWKLTRIIGVNGRTSTLKEVFPIDLKDVAEDECEYYLPRLLSVNSNREAASIRPDIDASNKGKTKVKNTYTETNRTSDEVHKDLAWITSTGIMDLLDQERCDNYAKWLDIGFTLYCIGQGHPAALDIWKDWSQCSEKYVEGCCETQWVSMTDRGKSVRTLRYYARHDSPERYGELIHITSQEVIMESLSTSRPQHVGIARVLHKMYGDRFKCSDHKKSEWYEFSRHIWRKLDDGQTIKMLIVHEIRNMYIDKRTRVQEDEPSEETNKLLAKLNKTIETLDCTSFIDGVLKGCKILFYDKEFHEKINTNKDLYAFKNGVYDLRLDAFRDGLPDDFITMQSPINYRKPTVPELKRVKTWLRKLFPDPGVRKYWIRTRATTFQGGNRDKKIWMHIGAGWAGKSGAEAAIEKIHGPHRFKIPHEFILMNDLKSSGGPTPALWRGRFCRLMMTEEIGQNEKLNMGILKKLSGGDTLYARTHHEEGHEFDPQFKFDIYLNHGPPIPSKDKALFTRIRLIEYVSRFGPKDDGSLPPEDEEEQFRLNHFPANPNFREEELPLLLEPLAWYLLDDWKNYREHGLEEPEAVRKRTELYERQNDTFIQFISDKLHIMDKDDEEYDSNVVRLTDIRNVFNEWFKEQYPSSRNHYGLNNIREQMSSKLRPPDGRGKWIGVRFKTDEDVPGILGKI